MISISQTFSLYVSNKLENLVQLLNSQAMSNLINIGLLGIAFLSLMVALIPLLRDKPHIDFFLYIAEIISLPNEKVISQGHFYCFKIVNSGRRPVIITHVGGISKVPYWKWCLRSILKLNHFCIFSTELENWIKDTNNEYKTLKEGETIQTKLKILENNLIKGDYLEAARFYVLDSVGRKYYLPKKAHQKLKYDLKELRRKLIEKH